jgi:hypothetical protein
MPGLLLPNDRTTKQQPRGYCYNPDCRNTSDDERFEFDIDHGTFACPKCGSDNPVTTGLLVLVHFLVKDPKGPIRGSSGRFRFACDPTRVVLATTTNQEAASGDLRAVNCPGCLTTAAHMKLENQQGHSLVPK